MVALANNLEGGSANETAMTQGSGGNTGGASGDYFDVLNGGSGAAPTGDRKVFSTAHAAHGSYSMLMYSGASGGEYAAWTTQVGTITSGTLYIRAYFWLDTAAPSAANKMIRVMDSGGVEAAFFRCDAAPNPGIGDSAGTFTEPSGPVVLNTGQWYRVELKIPHGDVVTITGRLFYGANLDGTTADVEWTQASSDTKTTTGNFAEVRFGNSLAGTVTYYDDVAISTVDWIGPVASSSNISASDTFTMTDVSDNPGGGGSGVTGNGILHDMSEDTPWVRSSDWTSANTSAGRPTGVAVPLGGDYHYVSGYFDEVRNNAGTWLNRYSVYRVKESDLDLDSWAPDLTPHGGSGRAEDILASADGSLILVVGRFTAVNGSARPGVAVFDAATGALQSHFATWTVSGGYVTSCAIDGTDLYLVGTFNTFGPAGQSRSGGVKVTSWTTTPALDSSWQPVLVSPTVVRFGTVTGGTKRVFILCDGSPGPGSANSTSCEVAAVNATTGTSNVWTADYNHSGCIDMDINDELQLVITGSRGGHANGGNAIVCYDYAASGVQTRNWRFCTDGNMQGVGFYKGGKSEPLIYGGHHGKFTDPAKNTANLEQDNDQTASLTSMGLICLDKNGILQSWRPRFLQSNSTVGGVLKLFGFYGDEEHDRLFCFGDHTEVATPDNATHKTQYRMSLFLEDLTGTTNPPPSSDLLVNDPFDRGSPSSTTMGTEPVSGLTYTYPDGVWGIDGSGATGKAYVVSSSTGYASCELDPGAQTFPYTIEADITLSGTTQRVNTGLCFHSLGSRTTGLFFVKLEITVGANSNGLFVIGKHDSGSVSYGTPVQPIAIAEGETYHLKVTVDETSITAQATGTGVNETCYYTKTSTEQSKFNTAHSFGFRSRTAADEDDLGSRMDNLQFTANAGTTPPPPPPPTSSGGWTPSGIDGGGFCNVIGVSADGNTIYVGSDVGGLSRSTDKGLTYTPANRGVTGRVNKEIAGFGPHPTDPNVVVAAAGQDVLLSVDRGLNWTYGVSLSFEGHNLVGNNIGVPEKHPRNTGRTFAWTTISGTEYLLIGTFDQGLYISSNRGNTASLVGLGSTVIRGIKLSGSSANVVYVGCYQIKALNGGLYKVTNPQSTKTITKLSTPFNSVEEVDTWGSYVAVVGSIITRDASGNVTGQTDGVWLSDDDGATWARVGASALGTAANWCAIKITEQAVNGDLTIYVGCSSPVLSGGKYKTLMRSTDSGATWSWISDSANVIPSLGNASGDTWWQTSSSWWLNGAQGVSAQIEVDPNDPSLVYSAGRSGVWRSENANATAANVRWYASMRGLCVASILDVVFDDTKAGRGGAANVDWDSFISNDYFASVTQKDIAMEGSSSSTIGQYKLGGGSNPRKAYVGGGSRDLPDNTGGHVKSNTDPATNSWVDESGGNPAVWGAERPFGLGVRVISGTTHLVAAVQGDGIWTKHGASAFSKEIGGLLTGNPEVQHTSVSWEHDGYCWIVDRNSGLWRGKTTTTVMDTWELVWGFTAASRSTGFVAADPNDSGTVYVSKLDGLFRLKNATTGTVSGGQITVFNMGLTNAGPLTFDENGYLYVTTRAGAGDVKFMRYQSPGVTSPVGTNLADDVYRQSCILPVCVDVWNGHAAVGCDGMGLIINFGLGENTAAITDGDTITMTDAGASPSVGAETEVSDSDTWSVTDAEDATGDASITDSDGFSLGDTNLPFEGRDTNVEPPPVGTPPPGTPYFAVRHHFTATTGQATAAVADAIAEDEPGGYTTVTGTVLPGEIPEPLLTPGAEWRIVGSDGHEVWYGDLIQAVARNDRIELTGRGTRSRAERFSGRLMFLSRNAADFQPGDSDPYNYKTGDAYEIDAQGSRIAITASKDADVNPNAKNGVVFWAEDNVIQSVAFNMDWNGTGAVLKNVIRIMSALGPNGTLTQAGGDISMDTTPPVIDRNIAGRNEGTKRPDLIWIGMHRVDDVASTFATKIKIVLTNLRVRGLVDQDQFFGQDVVKEVCARLGVDDHEVQFDGVDLHALDHKDGSYADLLDLIALLTGYRWRFLHNSQGIYCDFGPWEDKTWYTTRAAGPSDIYGTTIYNRASVRYTTTRGIVREVMAEPIDIDVPDPYEQGLEIVFPQDGSVELVDRYNTRDVAEQIATRLLRQVIVPRLGGTMERVWLEDENGNVVPSYHAMSGDTIVVKDGAAGQALSGRIIRRSVSDKSCTFEFDNDVMEAAKIVARATRDPREG